MCARKRPSRVKNRAIAAHNHKMIQCMAYCQTPPAPAQGFASRLDQVRAAHTPRGEKWPLEGQLSTMVCADRVAGDVGCRLVEHAKPIECALTGWCKRSKSTWGKENPGVSGPPGFETIDAAWQLSLRSRSLVMTLASYIRTPVGV